MLSSFSRSIDEARDLVSRSFLYFHKLHIRGRSRVVLFMQRGARRISRTHVILPHFECTQTLRRPFMSGNGKMRTQNAEWKFHVALAFAMLTIKRPAEALTSIYKNTA